MLGPGKPLLQLLEPPKEEPEATVVLGFWSIAPSKPSDQRPKSRGYLQGRLLLPSLLQSSCLSPVAFPWPSKWEL